MKKYISFFLFASLLCLSQNLSLKADSSPIQFKCCDNGKKACLFSCNPMSICFKLKKSCSSDIEKITFTEEQTEIINGLIDSCKVNKQ